LYLGDHVRYDMMTDRSHPEFKPIEIEEKNKGKIYFCVGRGSLAAQIAYFKTEGAIILERYCDACVSKFNQSTPET
jgi:hypothetical protein